MNRTGWDQTKQLVEKVASQMVTYADYLNRRKARDQERHAANEPMRSSSTSSETYPLKRNPNLVFSKYWNDILRPIVTKITQAENWQPVFLNELLPTDRKRRFKCLNFIKDNGFPSFDCCLFTYASGNHLGNQHFMWKETVDSDTVHMRIRTLSDIQANLPTYHTRHMRSVAREKLAQICPSVKSHQARAIYRLLTGDESVSEHRLSKEMDERMQLFLENADEDIIIDLRKNNGRPHPLKDFGEIVDNFLAEKTAVDDRRHDDVTSDGDIVTHVAMATSMSDMYRQVTEIAREKGLVEEDIPTYSWFRLQFWPKNKYQRAALHHTGRFKVKAMVQQRQLRKTHVDAHYASAVYRYLKEFAVLHRNHCLLLSLDDKAKVPIGEPDYPVAAVTRGKRVIVRANQVHRVANHDFTRMSFIPSVTLVHDIPSTIDGSFYSGIPCVGIKFTVTEGSTSYRHMTELSALAAVREKGNPPIHLFYTDGGPDHNVMHLSVQLSLIAYFLVNDLDMLIAVRTPPGHSYKNPAERVNAIVNLGLQSIGVMRQKLDDEALEKTVTKQNNITQLRAATEINPNIKEQLTSAVEPARELMKTVIGRCKLKENDFQIFESASEDEVETLFSNIHNIDPDVTKKDTKAKLNSRPGLKSFLDHHCRARMYSFSIKKCGQSTCCKPPRTDRPIFDELHFLPDPVPDATKEHYLSFQDLYGKQEMEDPMEKHLPQKAKSKPGTNIPFVATIQSAKTVQRFIKCTECGKPRVMYAQRKVNNEQQQQLDRVLDGYLYTCGGELQDIIPEEPSEDHEVLDKVYVRGNLNCCDVIECTYYGVTHFPLICVHCADDESLTTNPAKYPICLECTRTGKQAVLKPGKRNYMDRQV